MQWPVVRAALSDLLRGFGRIPFQRGAKFGVLPKQPLGQITDRPGFPRNPPGKSSTGKGDDNGFDMETLQKIPPVRCACECFGVSDEVLASPPRAIRVSGRRRSITKINTAQTALSQSYSVLLFSTHCRLHSFLVSLPIHSFYQLHISRLHCVKLGHSFCQHSLHRTLNIALTSPTTQYRQFVYFLTHPINDHVSCDQDCARRHSCHLGSGPWPRLRLRDRWSVQPGLPARLLLCQGQWPGCS